METKHKDLPLPGNADPYLSLAKIVRIVSASVALAAFVAIPLAGYYLISYYAEGQSTSQLQAQALIAGGIGILLAFAIYFTLKIFLLRTLTGIILGLEESRKLLREEVLAKELALLKAQDIGVAMRHQALHDGLTNLPNRILLHDRLKQAALIVQREKKLFGLIMMDLDQFKAINDTLGHHVGDLVLQQVATRLQQLLRGSDTVARLGGDEFAILLISVTDMSGVVTAAQKILDSLRQPLCIEEHTLHAGASLGLVLFPDHGNDPETLLRCADVAMYSAKRAQSGFSIYNVEQDSQQAKKIVLERDLREAIDMGQLVLHYQPKINLLSNRISGVEALVRWEHPKEGILYPDDFIPVAEKNGLIKPLTRAVLIMALRQSTIWHNKNIHIPIAINISGVNIQDQTFPDQVAKIMQDYPVPSSLLEMEITETALMEDPLCAIETIKKLGSLGITITIDDFGIGYSSMA